MQINHKSLLIYVKKYSKIVKKRGKNDTKKRTKTFKINYKT